MQFLYGQASLQYSKALVTVCGRGWNKNANNGAAGEEREGRSRSECHGSTQHEV